MAAEQRTPQSSPGAERPADWRGLKEDVTDVAGNLAGAAAEHGRHFIDATRNQAVGYVDLRKQGAAQSVADVANALREVNRSFEDRPQIKAFVDSAADGLDDLAGSIRDRSVAEIYSDVEEVLRRRPAVVAAASLVAGFFVARFIKSSAEDLRAEEARRRQVRPAGPSRQTGAYNAA